MKIPFEIKKISILLQGSGPDRVSIDLEGPTPFPVMNYDLYMSFEVQRGYGIQWVEDNLPDAPVTIIDCRT